MASPPITFAPGGRQQNTRTNNNKRDDTKSKPLANLPPSVAVPFMQFGAWSKEVLYGAKGQGLYVTDHKVTYTTRTANGVSLVSSAVRVGDTLSGSLMGSWAALPARGSSGPLTLAATALSTGALELEASQLMSPHLKASVAASLAPGPVTKPAAGAASPLLGRSTVEYVGARGAHAKVTSTLEPAPVFTLTAGSGIGRLLLGGELTFSTPRAQACARDAVAAASQLKTQLAGSTPAATTTTTTTAGPTATTAMPPAASTAGTSGMGLGLPGPSRSTAALVGGMLGGVTRWTAGLAYHHQVHQLALYLSDTPAPGKAPALLAKATYALKLDDATLLAAEVSHGVALQKGAGPVAAPMASLGFQRFVGGPDVEEGSGGPPPSLSTHALVKVKVDSVGVVSALYSDRLLLGGGAKGDPTATVTLAAQVNTLDPLGRAPKLGVTIDLA